MPTASDFGRIGSAIIAAAPNIMPGPAASIIRKIASAAIDGVGALPGARETAGEALAKHGLVEDAIDTIVRSHVAMAGAQGFVTNIGGVTSLLVGLPANLVGVSVIQTRMVAAIAHLRGYDIDDARVRHALLLTMLGRQTVEQLVAEGKLPSTPLGLATAPAFDSALEQQIAEQVLRVLMTRSGGKQAVAVIGRAIPVIGGGVGFATDSWFTLGVARYAREQFVNRRTIMPPATDDEE